MRLADDERARVPFALVGVLLLVGSTTLAATLATRPADGVATDGDAAMERADAAVTTALRTAVDRAARNAAADPVVSPANTTYGRVLNDSRPFRDALALRVYRQARLALATVDARAGDARATADLPAIEGTASARAAIERVDLRRTGNGTVRVAVSNVSVTLWRHDRAVDRRTTTVRFTSATPVLLVHDRVAAYERRLSRGPTEGRGFGRQFAARLYAWAWARGYAQYGGLPVENVLGSRHVSLSANEAALATQRGVFGSADDAGRRALERARARLFAQEAIQQTPGQTGISPAEWTDLVLGSPDGTFANAAPSVPQPGTPSTSHDDPVTVGVNESATAAFARLLDGDGEDAPSFDELVRRTYSADVAVHAESTMVDASSPLPATPPGPRWERRGSHTDREARVVAGHAPLPSRPDGATRFATYERVVTVTETTTTTWVHGGNRTETERTERRTYRIGVAVDARPAAAAAGPDGRIEGAFGPGGVLGGDSRADVRRQVLAVVDDRGGPDALAADAATGKLDESPVTVFGTPPGDAETTAYLSAAALRDRTRDRSVTTSRGELVTDATPAATLAAELAADSGALVGAERPYSDVTARLRAASRAAYLDALAAELDERAGATARSREGMDAALAGHGLSLAEVDATMAASSNAGRPSAPALGDDGPAGPVSLDVAAAPSYLVTSPLETDRLRSVRRDGFSPLVARNVNLFTVPYGEAGDEVAAHVDEGADGDAAALATGARALAAMEYVGRVAENESARRRRDRLRGAVAESLAVVRGRVATDLAGATTLSYPAADAAVGAAFDRYPTTAARARAVVNGSLAPAVASEAVARLDDRGGGETAVPSARRFDELRVRATTALRTAVQSRAARLPQGPVEDSSRFLRDRQHALVAAGATSALTNGVEGYLNGSSDADEPTTTFAGLPLVPFYSWVVTTNVWVVQVRGTYPRFTVRADRGSPAAPGGLVFSRDGAPVRVDVDGDGQPELLGHADRVSFESTVGVVVAVPPGEGGVGDVDGVQDEQTGGWPCPGRERWPAPAHGVGPGGDGPDGTGPGNASDCSKDLYAPGQAANHVPRTPDRRVGALPLGARSRVRGRAGRRRRGPRGGRRRRGDRRRPGPRRGGRRRDDPPGVDARTGRRDPGARRRRRRRRHGPRDGLRAPPHRDDDGRARRGRGDRRTAAEPRGDGGPAED